VLVGLPTVQVAPVRCGVSATGWAGPETPNVQFWRLKGLEQGRRCVKHCVMITVRVPRLK
jgi:hypothetical protein